jgi:hypothetical protein
LETCLISALTRTQAIKIKNADTRVLEAYSRRLYSEIQVTAGTYNSQSVHAEKSGVKNDAEDCKAKILLLYGKTVYSFKVLADRYEKEGRAESLNCLANIIFLENYLNESGFAKVDISSSFKKARKLFEKFPPVAEPPKSTA